MFCSSLHDFRQSWNITKVHQERMGRGNYQENCSHPNEWAIVHTHTRKWNIYFHFYTNWLNTKFKMSQSLGKNVKLLWKHINHLVSRTQEPVANKRYQLEKQPPSLRRCHGARVNRSHSFQFQIQSRNGTVFISLLFIADDVVVVTAAATVFDEVWLFTNRTKQTYPKTPPLSLKKKQLINNRQAVEWVWPRVWMTSVGYCIGGVLLCRCSWPIS